MLTVSFSAYHAHPLFTMVARCVTVFAMLPCLVSEPTTHGCFVKYCSCHLSQQGEQVGRKRVLASLPLPSFCGMAERPHLPHFSCFMSGGTKPSDCRFFILLIWKPAGTLILRPLHVACESPVFIASINALSAFWSFFDLTSR